MKMNPVKVITAVMVLYCAAWYVSCSSTAAGTSPQETTKQQGSAPSERPPKGPFFTGDGGKGMVIAVPAPVMKNSAPSDSWMPQLFQDLITGDLAKYSAMTVVDRSNETLVKAEQQNSLSGDYSDTDYLQIGNMTNAKYIVAGSILTVSGTYTVSFRINNVETNEIQATFSKSYASPDIERGLAAKEAVRELLTGMGIVLTEAGETSLLAIPEVEVRATAKLAKGMAAEKSDNIVEALAFYTQALESNTNMREASEHIRNFAAVPLGASIRERAEYNRKQKEKWEKLFTDLKAYIQDNLPVFVYDFSSIKDEIKTSGAKQTVIFTVTPGVKLIPNRTVLLVYKTVLDEWFTLSKNEENREWVKSVRVPYLSVAESPYDLAFDYSIDIGLYDDYGDRIAQFGWYNGAPSLALIKYADITKNGVIAQHKYYNDAKPKIPSSTGVPIEAITDQVTPKIERVYSGTRNKIDITVPVMTVAEWEQWLKESQGK